MSAPGAASGPPVAALVALLGYLALERGLEVWLSRRNARRLEARGAREHGRGHFPLFVILHALWPLGLVAEVALGGARPGRLWPAWLALLLVAQALRFTVIAALGERWNVRVLAVPGEPPIPRDVHLRLVRLKYAAVIVELAAAPLLFGAWRTALAAGLFNLAALAIRIPCEERALKLRA